MSDLEYLKARNKRFFIQFNSSAEASFFVIPKNYVLQVFKFTTQNESQNEFQNELQSQFQNEFQNEFQK